MDKIAVIGMANLFPGSKNPGEFWQSLIEKKDTRSQATQAQIGSDPEGFYGKKGDTDKYYCMSGGYIRNFTFDSNGYDLPANYLAELDQIFQWPLYVAREALRDGGYLDNKPLLEHCGVILGNLSFPTKKSNHMFLPLYHKTVESGLQHLLGSEQYKLSNFAQAEQPHPANGLIAGYPSSLVAQSLGLGGCNFSLDAACASSCYSVKLACDYLNTGKSKIMLAGAVSAADPFFVNMGFSIFQAYPSNNHSAPLDKNSGGLFAGEGAGMMLLKRYDDALADGDHIYAVIKGGGLSNDGKGEFVLSPNTKGQVLVYERAYADADVSPNDVEFVECHATGTPKGDKVELSSMETFFGRYDAKPLIGSVKSNVSHLLTAAGMPGMIKTIMAMNEGLIPPTINVEEPNSSPSAYINGSQIPTDIRKWPDTAVGKPRHAGVSVFGFGGSNAHLVFEQYIAGDSAPTAVNQSVGVNSTAENEQLAIVGMDVHFGACEGLENFKDSVINGKQHFTTLPQDRWKGIDKEPDLLRTMGMEAAAAPQGAYVDEFEMDFLRFKVPPNPNDCLIAQQLLMMKVADNAAKQAQLKESSHVAVLVAMGIELEIHQFRGRVNLPVQIEASLEQSGIQLSTEQRQQLETIAKDSVHNAAQLNQYTSFIGNIMASRISSLWDFSGPAITVSAEENSVYRCLEIADNLFQTSDVEAVIVAGVDLAGSAESVVWRNQFARLNSGNATLSFDNAVNGWMVGEGAGAVVLKRLSDAKQDKNQIFAAIEAIDFAAGVSAASVKKAANKALSKAAFKAQDVNYVEVHGSGLKNQDDAEMTGLGAVYRDVAVGCVKSNIGHTYSASGIASLIKTALCLHAAVIPATPQWQTPKAACTFAVPTQAQTWTGSAAGGKRLAAINGLGFDGFSAHILLSSVAGFEQAMPEPAVQGKARPQLMKTIKLGGPHIKGHILKEEHKATFSSVTNQFAAGGIAREIQNPVRDYPNSEAVDIPVPISQIPSSENSQLQTNQKVNAMTAENKFQQPVLDESSLSEVLKSSAQISKYKENMSNIAHAHNAFLNSRQQSLQKISELIMLQAEVAGGTVSAGAAVPQAVQPKVIQLVERYNKPDKIIWDTDALVEFAEGDIAKVFGEEFAIIDGYSRRTRLPTTDYLLVTRVTELEAETGKFEPCMMTTEYDVPTDAPYLVDGQVPWAVSVESGQCDLLLISYLGIDFQCKGDRVYRLLDCTLTFLEDMAFGGETLRYEIYIDSFARNGDTLLFFFHYDCFVGDKKVLIMRGGCAGFFTDKELEDGKGVVETDADRAEHSNAVKQNFNPLISNNRLQYEMEDMRKLVSGDIEGCFGQQYATGGANSSLKFASEKFLMIERVSKIDRTAGSWGLGILEAHKQLEPEHWYFPCHFKDDQVMAGSLMAEGCGQLVMFYMMFLGMQTGVKNARFQPMPGESQKVRCRGQVLPQSNVLTYRLEVTAIGMEPQPYIKANVDIILDGKVVVDFKNIGVMMKEEPATPGALLIAPATIVKKDPFANVNAPLMKVESDDSKPLNKGVTAIKHFEAPIIPGGNRAPDVVPYEPYHLFEFATGDIGKCFGSEFDFYKTITPPRTPCGDLQLTTRVTEVRGKRGEVKKPAYCKGEYEVPEDAWYFTANTYENQMPYSILMEISLQPNGFVSAWVGTTLELPGEELFFRNLDGEGELLRHVDLRGKTIINDSNLLSTTILGKNIIQSFDFTLSTDGEPFYKGTAVFGYFLADALKDQLGLDNGKVTRPWHIDNNTPANQVERIELRDENMPMYQAPATKPHYRLAGGQLHFIDTVDIVEGGGKADIAYVYSEREIDPTDWFFRYHFHGDPVMPGSLGVEAIIESMQVYALKNDLGAQFKNPRFAQILSNIKWKYRGQINPLNKQMSLDVHITKIIKDNDRVTIIGDANLSKDGLRIYEVFDIAICLEESK